MTEKGGEIPLVKMKIPEPQHTTKSAIIKWYESQPQKHRPHMGASIIGHDCERYIWNTFRWALKAKFPGRLLRLFDTGKREESRLIEELKAIGATVWETDESGNQWRVAACNGHFGGSLDGVAQGLPEAPKSVAVLEFKTSNHDQFTKLVNKRVAEAKPQHYAQMQVYMGLMEIDRAMYMAVNKDTDDLYCEWVHLDRPTFDGLLAKAQRLIDATEPPQKIGNDASWYQCRFCTFVQVCHGDTAAEANCRTCCHSTPVDDGKWHCGLKHKNLTHAEQLCGCSEHLMIPALVPYAEPQDGGDNYVVYKHKTSGIEFSNGPGPKPSFLSVELHKCPGALIQDVSEAKKVFPDARVVSGTVFDDMQDDDVDSAPSKPTPAQRKEVKLRISKTVQALQAFQPATLSKPSGSLGEDV